MRKIIEWVKGVLWRSIYGPWYRIRYVLDKRQRAQLRVMDSQQTIQYILQHKCSVCRYGDGEFQMIKHLYLMQGNPDLWKIDTFQQFDQQLARKLGAILVSSTPKCLICIPHGFCNSKVHKGYDRLFLEREYLEFRNLFKHFINRPDHIHLGDSYFTRFYLNRNDISDYISYIHYLKQLWENRAILLVEGTHSRLGVGNDLFDNASSIQRILAPAKNAFSVYNAIIEAIYTHATNHIILLALGQTATVLAYDLTIAGYQAIDIGHVDIEYEWARMGAKDKVAIPNKYVNEVQEGRINTELNDATYRGQIVARID